MTVQNRYLTTTINSTITEAPARVASKNISIDQVVILLNGNKKAEQVLPHALNFAREQNAELVIVHTYEADMNSSVQKQAELYLKSVKNKSKAQYDNVIDYLHVGTSMSYALQSVLDNQKQTCVMVMNEKRNWLHRMLQADKFAEFANYENVLIQEVVG